MNPYNKQRITPPFTSQTKLGDLVCQDFSLLLIATRYGIPLGFGDRSIGQICAEYKLDTPTLLLLLNISVGYFEQPNDKQLQEVHLDSLIHYLSNSHRYFLEHRLPDLRPRLLAAVSNCHQEVAQVIRSFYDDYVEEVRKHMNYEEKVVFPYARRLAKGELDPGYNINIFRKRHDHIELKITELKNLLIKYYPASSGYELNNVLHEIFSSEQELAAHNLIEDNLFTPYISELECALKRVGQANA